MATPLSSRWTPFYKFALPLLTLGGIGAGAFYEFVHPESQKLPPGIPQQYGWVVVFFTGLLIGVIFWWAVADLKRVELDGDELIISNYRTEIRVMLTAVETISARSMTNPPRYTLTFAESTEFGNRITFLPAMEWTLLPVGEPQSVVELRAAWDTARNAATRRR